MLQRVCSTSCPVGNTGSVQTILADSQPVSTGLGIDEVVHTIVALKGKVVSENGFGEKVVTLKITRVA